MTNRKILMPFFMLGQFDDEHTLNILKGAVKAGADYLELGIPHSDPLADGPILRETAEKAIANGMTPEKALALCKLVVEETKVPVYVLTYLNTLFGYGVDAFIEDAISAGIEGLIIPDLPLEAQGELRSEYNFKGLTVAAFTSPTSAQRLEQIVKGSDGLIYSVNYTGITGSSNAESAIDQRVVDNYKKLKKLTDRKILSGFGIDSPEKARSAAQNADGVIIGTKICKLCIEADIEKVEASVSDFISSVRQAIG